MVGAQEIENSKSYAVIQKSLLDAFEDCNRQSGVHVKSHKEEVHTGNFRKQCYVRSTAKEHHESFHDFGAE